MGLQKKSKSEIKKVDKISDFDTMNNLDIIDIDNKINQKILTNLPKKSMVNEYSEKYSFYMMTTLSNIMNLLTPADTCNRSGMYLRIENNKLTSISVDPANVLIVETWIDLEELVSYMFDVTKTMEFSVFINEKENASSILSPLGIDSNIEIYILRDRPEYFVFENKGFTLKFRLMDFTDGDIVSSKNIFNANVERFVSKNNFVVDSAKFLLFNNATTKKITSEEKKYIVYSFYKDNENDVVFAMMGETSIYLNDNQFDFSKLDTKEKITVIKKFNSDELKSNNYIENTITKVGISYTNLFKNILKNSTDIQIGIGFDSFMSLSGNNILIVLANVPIESED